MNPTQSQAPLIGSQDPGTEVVIRDVDGNVSGQVRAKRSDEVEELFGAGSSRPFARDCWLSLRSDVDVTIVSKIVYLATGWHLCY